ncbi:hypothetical protein DPMN_037395 [Dreissena polymorpha]|uniref:Uncharacterized protein n=1 Tax=Dreissena polymorpha TaxID=45954 RepID=A0A9D4RP33_DREPO|nr:hypothetical protein DPMN_037395 [Dreissena polymorpha]
MSAPRVKRNSELIRISDFRRELSFREKKVAEIKREKMKILADIKPVPKYMITVDMSHARGNLDAVRMCLRELEWKEVIVDFLTKCLARLLELPISAFKHITQSIYEIFSKFAQYLSS